MRIGILGSRGYPSTYGGFETLVRHLAPALHARGHDVTVYGREDRRGSEIDRDGIRCVTTRGIDRKTSSTLSFGLASALDARRRGLDTALVLNCANGYFLPILKRAGIRTVVNVDGVEWERAKWNRAARGMFKGGARATARHADEIVVDSEVIGDLWRRDFQRRSTFIPYGADLEARGSARVRALGLTPGSYLLLVARLVPENNVDLFIDAWLGMWPRPPAVVVGTAGYGGPLEERIRRATTIDPRLRWLGHVADQELLAELWTHCGAYFHGHSAGGTNPALVQAMGCGAPIAAIDTPYNREVVGGDESMLVDPDVAAIGAHLRAVLADHATQERLRERGRTRAAIAYCWDDVIAAYAELLAGSRHLVGVG